MRILKISIVLVIAAVGTYLSLYRSSDLGRVRRGVAGLEAEGITDIKIIKTELIHSLTLATLGSGEVEISMEVPLSFCDKYQNLELTVEAIGRSVSGEPVQMAAKRHCYEIGLESKRVSWLFHPQIPADENYFHKNLFEPLPSRWYVKEINFYSNEMEHTLKITSYELISIFGAPIEFGF